MPAYSALEKMSVIDEMIHAMRPAADREPAAAKALDILKAIDQDIRATVKPIGQVFTSLAFQVQSAQRQKANLDYVDEGHCRAIATEVMAKWPAITLALRAHRITPEMVAAGAKSLQTHYAVADGTAEHVAKKFLCDVFGVDVEAA